MHKTTMGWLSVAGALVFCAGLGAEGAQAQNVPPGCTSEGNGGGAAAGALLGGIAGALLGNAVGGRQKAGGTIIGGVTGAAAGAMIGGSQPCPQGYAYRAAPVRSEDPPPRRLFIEEPAPRRVRYDDVWYGAPPRIHERIVFMRHRIEKLDADGWLSPRESESLLAQLTQISDREAHIRDDNDGQLPPEVRGRLDDDLNGVARRLRWKEYRTQHAEE